MEVVSGGVIGGGGGCEVERAELFNKKNVKMDSNDTKKIKFRSGMFSIGECGAI